MRPDWMMLAGIALLTAVFVRMTVRRRRGMVRLERRVISDPIEHVPRPKHQWDGAQHDAAALVGRQTVELHETAREITSQLATKVAVFERLVAQSSAQIKRMEQLLDELHAAEHESRATS